MNFGAAWNASTGVEVQRDVNRRKRTCPPCSRIFETWWIVKVKPTLVFAPTSKVTSDCIVDTFEHMWIENKDRFPNVDTLVFLQDNGPENSGRRSQFLCRMVQFVEQHKINVRLTYYPPYHSKYNPVERCWGILENHWNGALLDTIEAVVGYAQSMTWKQEHPVVRLVTQVYQLGVRLSKKAMKVIESKLSRLPSLPSWFIDIHYKVVV